MTELSKLPLSSDYVGWFNYYVSRYCKTRAEAAAHLACWYYLLALESGKVQPARINPE